MARSVGVRITVSVLLLLSSSLLLAGTPIATTETNWKGVSIDLSAVERKANILTVKWAVRNGGTEKATVQFFLTGKSVTTYVVDEESGTKYYVLTDKEKHSLASAHKYLSSDTYGIEDDIAPGETKRFWMKLPAPPPTVKKVTVFLSNSEPLEGVAITDKP